MTIDNQFYPDFLRHNRLVAKIHQLYNQIPLLSTSYKIMIFITSELCQQHSLLTLIKLYNKIFILE